MLGEAYFPATLEESPHRWMTRPQKLAGLCQKIADDLPDYATRLPAPFGEEMTPQCTEWASRYEDLARELQKLRHPKLLHQNQKSSVAGVPVKSSQAKSAPNRAGASPQTPPARHSASPTSSPWAEERMHRTNPDTFFAQLGGTKPSHALESTASKFGSILALLLISSVAAVGVFLSEEDKPRASSVEINNAALPKMHLPRTGNSLPKTLNTPRDAAQHAYSLAYELAKQRVKTVDGLTRQQRLAAAREALAQVMGGNISRLDSAEILDFAKRAPDTVKIAAFKGVKNGESIGIRAKSQLQERMLNRDGRLTPKQTAH